MEPGSGLVSTVTTSSALGSSEELPVPDTSSDPGTSAARYVRLRLCLTAALAALAGSSFHEVFSWPQVIRLSVVAALVPTVIVGVAVGRGKRAVVSIGASAVAFLVMSALIVFHSLGGIGSDVVDATVNGWARLLTTSVPADPDPDLIFLPFAATWLAAAVGGELAARRQARLGAAVPGILAIVFAELFAVGLDSGRLLTALIAVVLISALTLADPPEQAGDEDSETGNRAALGPRLVRACGAVAAVAVFAVGVGPRLPGQGGERFDPRRYQEPPNDPRQAVNPLAQLAGWHNGAGAKAELFDLRATRSGPVILRLRLVALDHYDGRTWTEGQGYRSVGVALPAQPDLTDVPTVDVEQLITIKDLTGIWLPAADRPLRIEGATVLQNRSSGALVRRQGSVEDLQYGVASSVRSPSQVALRGAGASIDGAALGSPAIPPEITALAARWTAAGISPYEKALLIKQQLTSGAFKVDKKSLPGHDLSRLEDFLGISKKPAAAGAKRGDAEQFATAFAVLARAVGLPSRVVVGFDAGKPVDGRYVVRGSQATAWVEVNFDGLGWVPFDAMPSTDVKRTEEEKKLEEQKLKEEQALGKTITDPQREAPTRQKPPPPPEAPPSVVKQVARAVAALVVVVLVAGALYLGILSAVRGLRRRRRRSAPSPREQILGAWRDTIDELVDRGFHLRRHMTVEDIVIAAGDVAPKAANVGALGRLVNRVRFADDPCGPEDAEQAWSAADELRSQADDGVPLLARLRVRANPRSLIASY